MTFEWPCKPLTLTIMRDHRNVAVATKFLGLLSFSLNTAYEYYTIFLKPFRHFCYLHLNSFFFFTQSTAKANGLCTFKIKGILIRKKIHLLLLYVIMDRSLCIVFRLTLIKWNSLVRERYNHSIAKTLPRVKQQVITLPFPQQSRNETINSKFLLIAYEKSIFSTVP